MTERLERCVWCGKKNREASNWEQRETASDAYQPLCVPCAKSRLANPFNAVLPMRRRAAYQEAG